VWYNVIGAIKFNWATGANIITQIAQQQWPNIGPPLSLTLGQRWQITLGQCHFVRWANVEPFLIANFQPTMNQCLANFG
jgi:hypothetical protein